MDGVSRTWMRVALGSLLLMALSWGPRETGGAEPKTKEKSRAELFRDAIRAGKLDRVQELIDAGADLNPSDRLESTPLQWAADSGQVEVLRLLIKAGADIHTNRLRGTALHVAAESGSLEAVQTLVQAGADVNADGSAYGPTPLHCAADRCHVKIVKFLIEAGAKIDFGQMTPLTCACRQQNRDATATIKVLLAAGAAVNPAGNGPLHCTSGPAVTKLLIAAGADVNHRNELGQPPLHLASGAYWGPREADFSLMIAAGADVNARDKNQSTPLHEAVRHELPKVVKVLIDAQADLNAHDASGNTPLSLAQRLQSAALIKMLTEAGADDGSTLLGKAARQGNLKRVQELLAAGADVNETGPEQKTALHLACEQGQLEVARALIAAQADVNGRAEDGLTPLHLVTTKDLVEALFEAGAKIPQPASREEAYRTPLCFAAAEGRTGVVEALLEHGDQVPKELVVSITLYGRIDVLRVLLQHGGDPNGRPLGMGPSALDVATTGVFADVACPEHVTAEDRLEMAKLLIAAGANVNTPSGFYDGLTALHAAAEKGEVEMVKLLLAHQANPRATGAGAYFPGVTPLHLAAKGGHFEAAEVLLKTGARVNAKTGQTKQTAQTPLDMVGPGRLRDLLQEHGGRPFAELQKK